MIPVLDSNILIDITLGYDKAAKEMARYDTMAISLISWIEIMAGVTNSKEEKSLAAFLSRFDIVPVTMQIAKLAAKLRRQHRIKLPDAIIWATARHRNTLLVTRNSKDFPDSFPEIRIPYTL